jgi:hypothetical protein
MIGSSDSSKGWLRRWEVINFPYEPTKPDPGLSKRCTTPEELAGIAVKAVDALRMLMERGQFSRGESADTVHAEFAEKANRAIRWINDPDSAVVRDPDVWNKGTILVQAFREWEETTRATGTSTRACSTSPSYCVRPGYGRRCAAGSVGSGG